MIVIVVMLTMFMIRMVLVVMIAKLMLMLMLVIRMIVVVLLVMKPGGVDLDCYIAATGFGVKGNPLSGFQNCDCQVECSLLILTPRRMLKADHIGTRALKREFDLVLINGQGTV